MFIVPLAPVVGYILELWRSFSAIQAIFRETVGVHLNNNAEMVLSSLDALEQESHAIAELLRSAD